MTKFDVKVRNVDDDTLYTHKTLKIGSKSVETPAKAISVGKLYSNDRIAEPARGFNEIYFETNEKKLAKAQREFSSNLKSRIRSDLKKTRSDSEINVVFTNLKTVDLLERRNLEYLVDLIYSTSDFVTIPLMPSLLSEIKEDGRGTSSKYFQRYLTTIRNFIDIARQINGKPIMGTIPTLPRAFINQVIEIYINRGIQAFCFNFDGRTVTAESQLTDMVAPLMRQIAVQDMQEDVLLYSLNAHRGRSTQDSNFVPARDIMSFGFGMDILGDKHVGANLPPHIFEKIANSDPTFRLFHKDDYVYRNYHYGPELRANLPSDTKVDTSDVVSKPGQRYRLATILNGEQQSLEANNLRPAIDEHRVVDYVEEKRGIGNSDLDSMKSTKSSFEYNKGQQTLSGLDDMLG